MKNWKKDLAATTTAATATAGLPGGKSLVAVFESNHHRRVKEGIG
jgi:hypothetical protein